MHLFCGVVGPVLVTFHTSFKFNGLVSVAYWSMVIVMLSGFAKNATEKATAEEQTWKVAGVKAVKNAIEVRP